MLVIFANCDVNDHVFAPLGAAADGDVARADTGEVMASYPPMEGCGRLVANADMTVLLMDPVQGTGHAWTACAI